MNLSDPDARRRRYRSAPGPSLKSDGTNVCGSAGSVKRLLSRGERDIGWRKDPRARPRHLGDAVLVEQSSAKASPGFVKALRAEALVKIPGAWKHGELPDCFEPIEFDSFFVSYAKS